MSLLKGNYKLKDVKKLTKEELEQKFEKKLIKIGWKYGLCFKKS